MKLKKSQQDRQKVTGFLLRYVLLVLWIDFSEVLLEMIGRM